MLHDAAYLGRYAGQSWEEVLRMPRSIRIGIINETYEIVIAEKEGGD